MKEGCLENSTRILLGVLAPPYVETYKAYYKYNQMAHEHENSHHINIHFSFHPYQSLSSAASCPNPLNLILLQIHFSQCPWYVSKIEAPICLSLCSTYLLMHSKPPYIQWLKQLAITYFTHESVIWDSARTVLFAPHGDSWTS